MSSQIAKYLTDFLTPPFLRHPASIPPTDKHATTIAHIPDEILAIFFRYFMPDRALSFREVSHKWDKILLNQASLIIKLDLPFFIRHKLPAFISSNLQAVALVKRWSEYKSMSRVHTPEIQENGVTWKEKIQLATNEFVIEYLTGDPKGYHYSFRVSWWKNYDQCLCLPLKIFTVQNAKDYSQVMALKAKLISKGYKQKNN